MSYDNTKTLAEQGLSDERLAECLTNVAKRETQEYIESGKLPEGTSFREHLCAIALVRINELKGA